MILLTGQAAISSKGWWRSHQWLLLRRLVQLSILTLFLLGPVAQLWWIKGNLSASMVLDTIPLADPLAALQSLLAGHKLESSLILGATIVTLFYALVGGRLFCSWVCPINPVTDLAAAIRRRLKLTESRKLPVNTRFWMLALVLVLPALNGFIIWEFINPVSLLMRGLIFGIGTAWLLIAALFLFDVFVSPRGWCGHLCPLGAFYSLIGKFSLLRVNATNRDACSKCHDCFAVCPEPQVITLPLYGGAKNIGPMINDAACTQCGRCIDICSENVFQFSTRFANKAEIKS